MRPSQDTVFPSPPMALPPRSPARPLLALLVAAASVPVGLQGQSTLRQEVRGAVVDASSDLPLEGATVRVDLPQGAAARTGGDGRFLLSQVPAGEWPLWIAAPGFVPQRHVMNLELGGQAQVRVRLEPDPPAGGATAPSGSADPIAALGRTLDPLTLRAAAAASQDVADLIRRTLPELRPREGAATGAPCFEFAALEAGSARGMGAPRRGEALATSCRHPAVFVNGVRTSDPEALYRWTAAAALRRVQAIPPGETGPYFGEAPHGALLVETGAVGLRAAEAGAWPVTPPAGAGVAGRKTGFDWSQDPAGHPFGRTFLGALVGNAAGLAAGLAVGQRCVYIEERTDEIEFKCGNAGVVGAGLAAVALPALGSALGARLAGSTPLSRGRLVPAAVGAGMGVLPGYIFSLSTVGGGVETMNVLGQGFLLVGTPLFTALADRLYRTLR